MLFLLYTGEINHVIDQYNLRSQCYADDCQVHSSCLPDKKDELIKSTFICIEGLSLWMASNRLKLNPDKTEFMWLTSRGRQHLIDHSSIVGNVINIKPSSTVRFLEDYVDEAMRFEAHRKCCVNMFFQLRLLKVIRNCIPLDTTKTLVNAFAVTRLDYCNSLLAGIPSCQLDRLQLVFNATARLGCRASRYDHITPLLRDELHWFRCRERITFKLCVTVYKSLHNEAPDYLQELSMPVNMNTRRSTLRSASDGQLIPRTKTKAGERAFSVAGPLAWNSLPVTVRQLSSLSSFKRHLITYLFNASFPS